MSTDCTFINKPIDLGCHQVVMTDNFQLHFEGWIEPRENDEDPAVTFDFGEAGPEAEKYTAEIDITFHDLMEPLITFRSDDIKGVDGQPSVNLYSGSDPDSDPSSISVDAKTMDLGKYKSLEWFLVKVKLINPEGVKLLFATGTLKRFKQK